MGIKGLWGALGYNAGKLNAHGRVHIPTIGKSVGVELAGLFFTVAVAVCRSPTKAKTIWEHAAGGELNDPEIVLVIAESVVKQLLNLASCCESVTVVWEGKYSMKRHEAGRRAAVRSVKAKEQKWNQVLSLTPCMVELVKRRVVEKLGASAWMDPPGEGEVQLMHMLNEGALDVVLAQSGDSDFSIYMANVGAVVLCPQITGAIGGRKKNGFRGVSVWGKPVNAKDAWDCFSVGEDRTEGKDLSGWDMVPRALMGTCIGHDYDPKPEPPSTKKAQGIKGVAASKAVKLVAAAVEAEKANPANSSTIVRIARLVDAVGHKDDKVRLMKGVIAMVCHPVASTTGAVTVIGGYDKANVGQVVSWLDRNGEKTLATFLKTYVVNGTTYAGQDARGSCAGECGINFETALEQHALQHVEATEATVTSGGNQPASLDGRAQPTITLQKVMDHFSDKSNAAAGKHLEEGLERAYDSASSGNTEVNITIAFNKPNHTCCISMSSKQSQGRTPYKVSAVFKLTSCLGKVKAIERIACQCYRRSAEVVCRHRGSLLAMMWINSVKGLANDPAARANYWKRQARSAESGANKAVRLTTALTDRNNQIRASDTEALEAARTDLSSDDSDGEADAVSSTPGGAAKKKRKKCSSTSMIAIENEAVNTAFNEHFNLNVGAIQEIGERRGIPRLADFTPLP